MDFRDSIIAYYRGERSESALLFLLGILLLIASIAIWRNMGANDMLRGLFYPTVFLTAIAIFAGGFNAWNNDKRLKTFLPDYDRDAQAFVSREKERFEGSSGVNKWWLPLKITWSLLLVAGVAMTFITKRDFVHGIALGLIMLGFFGMVVDGFAQRRAEIYTEVLMQQ